MIELQLVKKIFDCKCNKKKRSEQTKRFQNVFITKKIL